MATSTRTTLFAAVALLCLVGVRGGPEHIEQCVELDGQYWPSSDENHSQPMPDMTYITIGAAFTSVKYAGTTKGYCNVIKMWFEAANATGGIEPMEGGKVGLRLLFEDVGTSEAMPDLKTSTPITINTLIDRGAEVVISPYTSTLTPIAAKAALDRGVPCIGPGAASDTVYKCPAKCDNATHCNQLSSNCQAPNSRRFTNLFGVFGPGPRYFTGILDNVYSEGARSIAVVREAKSFTKSTSGGAVDRAKSLSMDLQIVIDLNEPDISLPNVTSTQTNDANPPSWIIDGPDINAMGEEALRLIMDGGKRPDVVLGGTYDPSCHAMLKAMRKASWIPKATVMSVCVGKSKFVEAVGADARWVLGPSQWSPDLGGAEYYEMAGSTPVYHFQPTEKDAQGTQSPEVFDLRYKERWSNAAPDYHAASMMAGLYMLESALKAGGSTQEGAELALTAALQNVYTTSFWGYITTDATGKNEFRTMLSLQNNGEAETKLVYPTASRDPTQLLYPAPAFGSNERNPPCNPGYRFNGTPRFCTDAERADTNRAIDPVLGKYWCDTGCDLCAPGTFNPGIGSATCKVCPPNTIAVEDGANECSACPEGQYANEERTQCLPCASGTKRALQDPMCLPCLPGTFNPTEGASFCMSCDFDVGSQAGWQDSNGSIACNACPLNAMRALGTAGMSISECFCKIGFFHPTEKNGVACEECPDGAVCPGSEIKKGETMNAQPYPKPSYWADASIIANMPEGLDQPDYNNMKFIQCAAARCDGGEEFQCKKGYDGTMCTSCADDYHLVGNQCFKCPSDNVKFVYFVLGLFATLLVWLGLNTLAAGGFIAFDVTLIFLQVLSAIQQFDLSWPANTDSFSSVVTIINFDLDFYSPGCNMEWNVFQSFMLQQCLPIVAFVLTFVRVVGRLVWFLYKERMLSWAAMVSSFKMNMLNPSEFRLVEVMDSGEELLGIDHTNRIALADSIDDDIRFFVSFLVAIYGGISVKAFMPFTCTDGGGSMSFLALGPSVRCGSERHVTMEAIGALAVIFYAVGIPAAIYYSIKYGWKNNLLCTEPFLRRLGFLYTRYDPTYCFWDCVLLARRFAFCLLLGINLEPFMQSMIAVVVLGLAMGAHSYARPFKLVHVNILDGVASFTLIMYICAGLIFQDDRVSQDSQLGVFLMVLCGAVTIWGVVGTFYEGSHMLMFRNTNNVVKAIVKECTEQVSTPHGSPMPTPDRVTKTPTRLSKVGMGLRVRSMMDTTNAMLDALISLRLSGKEVVTLGQINFFLSETKHAHGPVHPVHPIIRRLSEVLGCTGPKLAKGLPLVFAVDETITALRVIPTMKVVTEEIVRMRGGALATSLTPEAGAAWLKQSLPTEQTQKLFANLTIWMHDALSDIALMNSYSYLFEAELMRAMLHGMPVVMDYLLECTPEQQEAFRITLEGIGKVTSKVGLNGKFARLALEEDHGGYCYWLTYATFEERFMLNRVLSDVNRCVRKMRETEIVHLPTANSMQDLLHEDFATETKVDHYERRMAAMAKPAGHDGELSTEQQQIIDSGREFLTETVLQLVQKNETNLMDAAVDYSDAFQSVQVVAAPSQPGDADSNQVAINIPTPTVQGGVGRPLQNEPAAAEAVAL